MDDVIAQIGANRQLDIQQSRRKALIASIISVLLLFGAILYFDQSGLNFSINSHLTLLLTFHIIGLWLIWFNPRSSTVADKMRVVKYSGRSHLSATSPNTRRFIGYFFWGSTIILFFAYIPQYRNTIYWSSINECKNVSYSGAETSGNYYLNVGQSQTECMSQKGFSNYKFGEEIGR